MGESSEVSADFPGRADTHIRQDEWVCPRVGEATWLGPFMPGKQKNDRPSAPPERPKARNPEGGLALALRVERVG